MLEINLLPSKNKYHLLLLAKRARNNIAFATMPRHFQDVLNLNIQANYDLLILGTPEKDNWLSVLFSGGKDKFVQNSVCSVLRLTIK